MQAADTPLGSADPRREPVIRTLWLHERQKLEAHLLRLGEHDRYMRFGGHVSDESLRKYCERIHWWQSHLVGWIDDEGELRAVGEARLLGDGWPREAELAFSVEAEYQGQGLGTELFRRLLTYARNRGVGRVYVTSLPTNVKMRRIARRFGLSVERYGGDEFAARMELRAPDYGSLFDEIFDEGAAHFIEGLRAPRRWSRGGAGGGAGAE